MSNPFRPLILDLGCCSLSAVQASVWEPKLPITSINTPHQANLLIVAGRLLTTYCPILDKVYEQLAKPKWVIAYGTCASSGAVFDTLPVEQIIPVDLFVAGCPPHPATLGDALATLNQLRRQ